jgi:hypothetical protein
MTTYLPKFVFVALLCLMAVGAEAAGIRFIDVPADSEGPALTGAVWSARYPRRKWRPRE